MVVAVQKCLQAARLSQLEQMYVQKTVYRRSRRGAVLKFSREHYLRDDLEAPTVATDRDTVVFDADCLVMQRDLLLHPSTSAQCSFLLLQSVLEDARSRNHRGYRQLREHVLQNVSLKKQGLVATLANEHLRETRLRRMPNETARDRRIRTLAVTYEWLQQRWTCGTTLRVVCHKADTKQRLLQLGVAHVDTVHEWTQRVLPSLVDSLAADELEQDETGDFAFEEFWSAEQVEVAKNEGRVVTGKINVRRGGGLSNKKAIVYAKGLDRPVEIRGMRDMNRCLDGDIVHVELLPDTAEEKSEPAGATLDSEIERQQDTNDALAVVEEAQAPLEQLYSTGRLRGRVVRVERRNWREYAGALEETTKQTGRVLFVPVDARIPKVWIETRRVQALQTQRIVVRVDSWPRTSKYPRGHYIRTLGTIGDRDAETAVLLLEHDVRDEPWSDSVMACLPENDAIPPSEEEACRNGSGRRRDLRHLLVCSIDPPGCKDIDDTLHCRAVPGRPGVVEVGVHIADVTHYVRPNTALDKEGQRRATSVYLVERRIDMLPTQLSTNCCSLVADRDRLAFSVLWHMRLDTAEVLKVDFCKSIIRSRAALSYAEAQRRIDDKSDMSDLTSAIRKLLHLSLQLKQQRIDAGALQLASTDVKFKLEKDPKVSGGVRPKDVMEYPMLPTNSLVEEFMLLANVAVAAKTLEHFPKFALLRRHPSPPLTAFEPLRKALATRSLDVDTRDSKSLNSSLDKVVAPAGDSTVDRDYFNKLVRVMTTRCMTQALYFGSGDVGGMGDMRHYGLASEVYTHFTSPIRRYADVVVHRLLATAIGVDPLPQEVKDRSRMHDACEQINHRHRMAQLAGRASASLYKLIFFRGRRTRASAVISQVSEGGISVIVPRYGAECDVDLVDRKRLARGVSDWNFDEERCCITKGNVTLRVFDKVFVEIFVIESKTHRQKLCMRMLSPEIPLPPLPHGWHVVEDAAAEPSAESAAATEESVEDAHDAHQADV